MSQPTALYRHRGSKGRLLYVGISLNVMARLAHHRFGSPWFKDIRRVDLEWFATREEAHAAEIKAIREENPAYNKERYAEPVVAAITPQSSVLEGDFGTVPLSGPAFDRVIDVICGRPQPFDTLEGVAINFGISAEYLSRFVAFPSGRRVKPNSNDMFALADRICRGTLASEAPWVFGTPLPDCDDEPTSPSKRRRPSHFVLAATPEVRP